MQNKNFHENSLRNLIFSVATLTFLLGSILLVTYLTKTHTSIAQTRKESDKSKIKVLNNINDLQIVNSKIEDDKFVIAVKNNSNKIINSFYLTTGNISYHIELIYSDVQDGIAPSSHYNLYADLDENLYSNGLSIRAILFEDGTGAGESFFIQEIKDKRYGEKLQLIKGELLLENLLSSPDLKPLEKLAKFKERISSLPVTEKDTQNEAVKLGMDLGRQRLLRYVEDLSKNTGDNKQDNLEIEITKIRNKLERYISKL